MDLQANNFGANCKYSKQTQVASLSGESTTLFWLELWYERDPECSTPSQVKVIMNLTMAYNSNESSHTWLDSRNQRMDVGKKTLALVQVNLWEEAGDPRCHQVSSLQSPERGMRKATWWYGLSMW